MDIAAHLETETGSRAVKSSPVIEPIDRTESLNDHSTAETVALKLRTNYSTVESGTCMKHGAIAAGTT